MGQVYYGVGLIWLDRVMTQRRRRRNRPEFTKRMDEELCLLATSSAGMTVSKLRIENQLEVSMMPC
jgi:hypothetical protein